MLAGGPSQKLACEMNALVKPCSVSIRIKV